MSETIKLVDLKAGMTVNVRSIHRECKPMVRTLTFAGIVKHKDGEWFYWRWAPGRHPDREGDFDCGFAGIRMDSDTSEYKFLAA